MNFHLLVLFLALPIAATVLAWKHPKIIERMVKWFVPFTSLNRRLKYLENLKLDGLWGDVHTLKRDAHTLKGDVQTLKVDVHTLKVDVHTLKVGMHTLREGMHTLSRKATGASDDTTYSGNSPLQLKDGGKAAAKELDSIIKKYMKDCLDLVQQEKRPYKIQKICFHFTDEKLWDILNEEEKELIEEVAFNRGWDKHVLLTIIALKMRDEVFSTYRINIGGTKDQTTNSP